MFGHQAQSKSFNFKNRSSESSEICEISTMKRKTDF